MKEISKEEFYTKIASGHLNDIVKVELKVLIDRR